MSICFTSYNLLDFTGNDDVAFVDLRQAVADARADVLAVQELVHDTREGAAHLLRTFAEAVGMECVVDGRGTVAVASSQHRYHVGLMWRQGIRVVPGSWRAYGAPDFWHALAKVSLDVGGPVPVTFASYHADPFRPKRRFDEALRVVAALTRPPGPAVVGADWNNISADLHALTGRYYDDDPWAGRPWFDDVIYQAEWEDDPDAPVRADRRPAEVLRRGGLLDAAAVLGVPWQPTVGHWSIPDPLGARRIDIIRTTRQLVRALRGYRVVRTPAALRASDHLPVAATFEPGFIGEGSEDHVAQAGTRLAQHRRGAVVTNVVGDGARIGGPLIQAGDIGGITLP